MRVAVIYQDDRVFVEFSPEKFKELLEKYYKETKSISSSVDKIVDDIKQETKYH
jgi:ferritin